MDVYSDVERVTSNPSREGAAWDVLVIVFNKDAVVSRQHWQVRHGAGSVLVVHTADVSLGRTLDGQRQTPYKDDQRASHVFKSEEAGKS